MEPLCTFMWQIKTDLADVIAQLAASFLPHWVGPCKDFLRVDADTTGEKREGSHDTASHHHACPGGMGLGGCSDGVAASL